MFTLIVGSLSFIDAELIGRNVWQYFGRDYGYLPLIQPLLGLAWLFNREIMVAYGIRSSAEASESEAAA